MAGLIGRIALGMTVDNTNFLKGVSGSYKSLQKFGGKINETGDQLGKFGGVLTGALAGLAGYLAVDSFSGFVGGAMESIAATKTFAKQIGVSTEGLSALQYAAGQAGVEGDRLRDALGDMTEKLGEAKWGGGEAVEALDQLGLSAEDLIALGPEKAFTKIADALHGLPSQFEKNTAAAMIFGDAGKELLPLMDQGAEGIDKLTEEAKKLGVSFNDVDAEKVAAASRAWGKLGAFVEGVGQQLAIAVAPFIEAASNKFAELATSGISTSKVIGKGMEYIASAVGFVADAVHLLWLGVSAGKAIGAEVVAFLADQFNGLSKAVVDLLNLLPGVKAGYSDFLNAFADETRHIADKEWTNFNKELMKEPPSSGIKSFFKDIQLGAERAAKAAVETGKAVAGIGGNANKATSDLKKLIESLTEDVKFFGLDSDEKAIAKLEAAGGDPDQIKKARTLVSQKKGLENNADLKKDAQALSKELRSPMQVFVEDTMKLKDMFSAGFLDKETLGRGIDKAQKDMRKAVDGDKNAPNFAGALEAGSVEARSAVLKAKGAGGADPIDKLNKTNLDGNRILQSILAEAKKNKAKPEQVAKVVP